MSHYIPRGNHYQQMPYMQRNYSQPRPPPYIPQHQPPNQSQSQTIPFFKASDYIGFKDEILAAAVPDELENYKAEDENPIQKKVEDTIDLNQNIINGLSNISNCLQSEDIFSFYMETKEKEMENSKRFSELLNASGNNTL